MRVRFEPFFALTVVLTWICLLPRLLPDRRSDRGIFVSTAERLLAGDRLYDGVFDNKEPLFYYFVAGQRALGWCAEWLAEALLILIAGAAVYSIAIKTISKWNAIAISFIAAPIILTGEYYSSGYSELPGIVLVLVSIAAAFHGRPVAAGMMIGVLSFTKLIYVPIAAVGVGIVFFGNRRLWDVRLVVFGLVCSTAIVALLLGLRGELIPFVNVLRLNIAYASGSLIGDRTGAYALMQHLKLAGGQHFAALAGILLFVNVVGWLCLSFKKTLISNMLASIGVLLASLSVLAVTGLWAHHSQVLYLASLLGLLTAAPLFDVALDKTPIQSLFALILSGFLLGGIPIVLPYMANLKGFGEILANVRELSPEARRILAVGDSGTYARLGQNDDLGHAVGLGNWKLACPIFHQYPFLPKAILDDALNCASKAPVLILAASLRQETVFQWNESFSMTQWNDFVSRAESLAKEFDCDSASGLRVCKRRP